MPHVAPMFIIRAVGFACLVVSTEAQPSGCSGLPNSPCGVLTSSTGSVSKMQFKDSGMADMVIMYSASSVRLGMFAFKLTPDWSGTPFTVHMECNGGSCTKGGACSHAGGSTSRHTVLRAVCCEKGACSTSRAAVSPRAAAGSSAPSLGEQTAEGSNLLPRNNLKNVQWVPMNWHVCACACACACV